MLVHVLMLLVLFSRYQSNLLNLVVISFMFVGFFKFNAVAMCDLVHDVETIFRPCKLFTPSENISVIQAMSRKLHIASFPGITHISENIFRSSVSAVTLEHV